MERDVRSLSLTRTCLGRDITVDVRFFPQGIHVSLYGGDLPHIGAVSVTDPEGNRTDLCFPGHRENTLTIRWSEALRKAGFLPAVVEAGVHYDGISREGIREVLACCDELLEEVLALGCECGSETRRCRCDS